MVGKGRGTTAACSSRQSFPSDLSLPKRWRRIDRELCLVRVLLVLTLHYLMSSVLFAVGNLPFDHTEEQLVEVSPKLFLLAQAGGK